MSLEEAVARSFEMAAHCGAGVVGLAGGDRIINQTMLVEDTP